ncbi:MAG: ABC transporter ATP-binding protein [Candidatus Methylomirabilota bacterium]
MNAQAQGARVQGVGPEADAVITVQDLTIAFGSYVVLQGLTFTIRRGDVFVLMGGSGCGKSTLMRCMIGLKEPRQGTVRYGADSYWDADPQVQERIRRKFGVLYQQGALWSSMTLAENIALPLGEYTDLNPRQIREVASLKLALVGLTGFEDYYPSEISGGMRKRAALARGMALDPEILFFDEPSAGLDPISSKLLDDLILELKESLGATIVIVTHELTSIFAIGSNAIFLDPETKTMIASGPPKTLLAECQDPKVHAFLTRGEGMAQTGDSGRHRTVSR